MEIVAFIIITSWQHFAASSNSCGHIDCCVVVGFNPPGEWWWNVCADIRALFLMESRLFLSFV